MFTRILASPATVKVGSILVGSPLKRCGDLYDTDEPITEIYLSDGLVHAYNSIVDQYFSYWAHQCHMSVS